MKKYFAMIALATLTLVACEKMEESKDLSNDVTTISAAAGAGQTKTAVDGFDVKWSAGDVLAVADEDDTIVEFTLTSGAGEQDATFEGTLGGKALGDYAVYPFSNAAVAGASVIAEYLDTWAYGKTEVPMWGANDGSGAYAFTNIGGAILVTYSNVPATTNDKYFVLTSSENITGPVTVSGLDSTPSVDVTAMTGTTVTVTGIPGDATSVSVIVPVPAGTGYNFAVELREATTDAVVPGSSKTASNRTITANQITKFPDVDLKPVITATPTSFSGLSKQAHNGQSLTYTISNVAAGAKVDAIADDTAMITNINTETAGTVTFNVTKNSTKNTRTGHIILSYSGADNVEITVEQFG